MDSKHRHNLIIDKSWTWATFCSQDLFVRVSLSLPHPVLQRDDILSAFLRNSLFHHTLIMTSALLTSLHCVCVSVCAHVRLCCTCYCHRSGVCFSNNSPGYETWCMWVRACLLVCAHTALLPRWLNYEAFTAVVMASSAFGNMSFYFRLGPNIQFEEGSQTIHDLFKKSSRGQKRGSRGEMRKKTFSPRRWHGWLSRADVNLRRNRKKSCRS